MSQEGGPLAILFADIARSTQLYEVLGDEEAQSYIASCIALLYDEVLHYQGAVIKTIGDEILGVFSDANDAVAAAKGMQRAIGGLPPIEKENFGFLNLYIGIHVGPVIQDGGDIFGDAVNIAARLVEMAKQRQILITEQTVQALEPENRETVHSLYQTMVRGKSGPISVYECIWEEEALTVVENISDEDLASMACMELRYQDRLILVDQTRPTLTIGRQSYNDLVIEDYCVSRSHARINYRRGQFLLTDQSTNGTYLLIHGEAPMHLKRDQAILYGSGLFSPGRELLPDSPTLIHFTIKL